MKNVTEQTDNYNDFADRLSSEILKNYRSVRAFALENGINPSTMALYATGQSEPTRPVLCIIAKALNVSLDWLATGEGSFNKNADMLDKKELILAIETVEESLNATNRTLKPAKKAELILAIYDLFTSENKPSSAQIISILSKIA